MLGQHEFEAIYNWLNLPMVDIDCGVKCNKFCCSSNSEEDNLFKYLLPGEYEYLVAKGFHEFATFEDYGFVVRFRSKNLNECACTRFRESRPFVCRMFPFRPVFDTNNKVIDLRKSSYSFFSPCWIENINFAWKEKAIKAWSFILADKDTLIFYSTYYLFVQELEYLGIGSFLQASKNVEFISKINELSSLSKQQLLQLTTKFFDYICNNNAEYYYGLRSEHKLPSSNHVESKV